MTETDCAPPWGALPCPTCGATPGHWCTRHDGQPLGTPHPARTYPWPCDRRDAHAPHYVDVPTIWLVPGAMHEDFPAHPCPGVPAHPATMIGRPASTTP